MSQIMNADFYGNWRKDNPYPGFVEAQAALSSPILGFPQGMASDSRNSVPGVFHLEGVHIRKSERSPNSNHGQPLLRRVQEIHPKRAQDIVNTLLGLGKTVVRKLLEDRDLLLFEVARVVKEMKESENDSPADLYARQNPVE